MKYRPGKLRRLGVVLSALWFITFAGWGPTAPTFLVDYFLDRFETKQKWACHQKNDWRFEDGTVPIEVKKQTEDCLSEVASDAFVRMADLHSNPVFILLVDLAWIALGWIVFFTIRWVIGPRLTLK